MSDELIKELRSYPEHYTAAHRAADALESAEKSRLSMHYYACRLEDDLVKLEAAAESLREHIAEQQLDIATLGQEVGRLREALQIAVPHLDENFRYLRDMQAHSVNVMKANDALAAARAALEEEKKA